MDTKQNADRRHHAVLGDIDYGHPFAVERGSRDLLAIKSQTVTTCPSMVQVVFLADGSVCDYRKDTVMSLVDCDEITWRLR